MTNSGSSSSDASISASALARQIRGGVHTLLMTPELARLLELEQLHAQWLSKLDALFSPRHAKLSLRMPLKSMLVPLTPDEEREELKQLFKTAFGRDNALAEAASKRGKQRQPMPDCNGLFCICKSMYNENLFMIACGQENTRSAHGRIAATQPLCLLPVLIRVPLTPLFFLCPCSDHCDVWFHGECVNLSIADAQSLQRYHCPKCSEKKGVTYPFGPIIFRHARPTAAECHALLAWIDEQLQAKQAAQLLQCDNARPLRRVLARIDEFKARVSHWLVGRHDGDNTHAAAAASASPPGEPAKSESASESASATDHAAAAAVPTPAATSAPLPALDASELSLIKGFIRQGKKLGINFSELSQSEETTTTTTTAAAASIIHLTPHRAALLALIVLSCCLCPLSLSVPLGCARYQTQATVRRGAKCSRLQQDRNCNCNKR